MKESNTKMKDKLDWRRNKVNELSVKGFSQADIARMLQISEPTISRDIEYLRQVANETIRNHIQKTLPYNYMKCIQGLEEIIKEAWIICINSEKIGNTKEKLQSLSLIKDTYNTKMDLLTNASLLQDSIKFVEEHSNNINNKKKEVLENRIQRVTEDNPDKESQQYNQVY